VSTNGTEDLSNEAVMALTVSVIIPTYNRAHLIRRSVESALAQLGSDDEVVVVDDASSDDTEAVVATLGRQVRYVRMAKNGGAGAARNAGVKAATKALIAFLDSDDLWISDKLTMQRAVLERFPEVLFCFSNFRVRDAAGVEIPFYLRQWHQEPVVWEEVLGPSVMFSSFASLPAGREDFKVHVGNLFAAELEADYVLTSTVVARREAADALHYAEDVPTWEDWECFGRLAQKGLGAYLDCETACQCGHDGFRLSGVDAYRRAGSALTIMPRVWGNDPAFMAKHGDRYEHVRAKHHLARARFLIRAGRTAEARTELAEAKTAPVSWRLLSMLPGAAVRGLFGLRRTLQRSS
jgi:hypothetical protein